MPLDGSPRSGTVIIRTHSNLIYWWPVWLYAAFGWGVTWFQNVVIDPTGQKEVKVFPAPWLGLAFLGVLFFVLLFSNMPPR
jgi:hypothetical protein